MPFSTESLSFLRGLARHNEKPWFEANRERYETAIRGPMRDLIEEMDMRLARLAPEIVGDVRRSPFRIYRDVRFSADKSPYKTHAACWFFHRDAAHNVGQRAVGGGAGFYFHLAPDGSFVGGGMWRPPRPVLDRLREAIAEKPRAFASTVTGPDVMGRFGGLGEEDLLKRTPRGYAADHPAAHWLRHKSFILGRELDEAEATSHDLPATLEADFAAMLPLVRWINRTLGLPSAARR